MSDAEHFGGIAQGIDDARARPRHRGPDPRDRRDPQLRGGGGRGGRRAAWPRTATRTWSASNWPATRRAIHPVRSPRAYEIAHDAGLGCSVHAGEHAGAESVRGALELPVTRIAHGVRAVEDPRWSSRDRRPGPDPGGLPDQQRGHGRVRRLRGAIRSRALREAGVRITLGSDDPPYFGCSIGCEYAVARERFGLDEGEVDGVDAHGLEGSFADEGLKQELLVRVAPAGR